MIAYIHVQEKIRSEPVIGINTPKVQLKLADIFSPLGTNICQPKSLKRDVQEFQYERADFKSSELVEIAKGADFSDQNLVEVWDQHLKLLLQTKFIPVNRIQDKEGFAKTSPRIEKLLGRIPDQNQLQYLL